MARESANEAERMLARVLTDLRWSQRISQAELARRLGRRQSFVSNYEKGLRRVGLVEFYAIVRALEADPAAVFAFVTERMPFRLEV